MRKVVATLAAAGVMVLFTAVPALAWHGNASGSAGCTEQGVLFTFAVASWDAQHPGIVVTRLGIKTTPATFQETLPFGSSSDSLDWKITWPDSQETDSGTIHASLEGACEVSPDLSIAKVADAATINAGDQSGFTITVKNVGSGAASDVAVSDSLPGAIAWSFNQVAGGWTCGIAAGELTCGGAGFTLAEGASASVHLYGTTDAQDCGVVSNTATAAASNEAANSDSNDSATATLTVRCASIHVTKTADQGTVSAGDTIGFMITVTNDGDGTATGVSVSDTLPTDPGLDWSIDAAGSHTGCSIGAGKLTCTFGALASGASKHVHITSPTTAATCGVVDNTANVTTSNDGSDSDEASVTVDCPKIDIEKKADAATVDAGEQIGFRIEITNNGIGTAKDVVVTDALPTNAGLTWSINGGSGKQFCSISAGVLTCDFGDMVAGAEYKVHITSDTDATTCGSVDNTATATVSNGEGDSDGASENVNCPPIGIDIQKDGPGLAHVGDTVTYSFTVQLTQDETLSNVTVTDPNCNEGAPIYLSGDDGDSVLEPGEVWSYTCVHLATAGDPDPLPNTATVQGTAADGRTATDSDDHSVDLIHPAIQIVKTVDPKSGNPGDTVTYTYVVTNMGDTTLSDISVDDDVIGHIGDIAQLAPGASVTLTKNFVLPSGDPEVTNVGTATGTDSLGEQVSDDDDAFVTIVEAENPPPSTQPTAFTGSGAARLGLIAGKLAALGLLGLLVGRRRREA
jgi:uncharacterized repeat protein (TIGR01451 family)